MRNRNTGKFTIKTGHALPLGVTIVDHGVQFAISLPNETKCRLNLYKKGHKHIDTSILLTEEYKIGSVFFVVISGIRKKNETRNIATVLAEDYEYMYEVAGEEFLDPYAPQINGRKHWGKALDYAASRMVRGGIEAEEFDWEGDRPLRTDLSDMILYQIHVRGFTKHASSGVKNRGTFAGLEEKIPYLKELGINGVLLLPCYDFDEILRPDGYDARKEEELAQLREKFAAEKQLAVTEQPKLQKTDGQLKTEKQKAEAQKLKAQKSILALEEKYLPVQDRRKDYKINYWGYGTGKIAYFAPKTSYAADKVHPVSEFKQLVKAFHQSGIEVIMDFYFLPGSNQYMIMDCLRHWVLTYHVDGFRINQDVVMSGVVGSDPILNGVKIFAEYWDNEMLGQIGNMGAKKYLAEYNEGFMTDARRYLKSDEGKVESFAWRVRRNPKDFGVINFISHVNGFTLMDLVSYDRKHNRDNGESNQDGTDYNYSWNCGIEGKTRRKKILQNRRRQIRNALTMVMLSQGTPMIMAGDEFGNSQEGNNNPYCQDNMITWLNWNLTKTNQDILQFLKELIAMRKKHGIFHQKETLSMMDLKSCGYPDFSVHGTKAWYPDYSPYNRMLGTMYAGEYGTKPDGSIDDYFYVAYNMHWEAHAFDLPNLPEGKDWYMVLDTCDGIFQKPEKEEKPKTKKRIALETQKMVVVSPRSIVVFVGM